VRPGLRDSGPRRRRETSPRRRYGKRQKSCRPDRGLRGMNNGLPDSGVEGARTLEVLHVDVGAIRSSDGGGGAIHIHDAGDRSRHSDNCLADPGPGLRPSRRFAYIGIFNSALACLGDLAMKRPDVVSHGKTSSAHSSRPNTSAHVPPDLYPFLPQTSLHFRKKCGLFRAR